MLARRRKRMSALSGTHLLSPTHFDILGRAISAVAMLLIFTPARVTGLFPEPELLDLTWNDEGEATYSDSNEKAALVDVWRSSGGLHWRNKWDLRADPCTDGWYGVLCDHSGHVVELDLAANGLTGYLPRSIGTLVHLRKLHLNDNLLSGPIPSSASKLKKLTSINLSQNKFTGSLPSFFSELEELILIHLAINDWNERSLPESYLILEQKGVDVWVI